MSRDRRLSAAVRRAFREGRADLLTWTLYATTKDKGQMSQTPTPTATTVEAMTLAFPAGEAVDGDSVAAPIPVWIDGQPFEDAGLDLSGEWRVTTKAGEIMRLQTPVQAVRSAFSQRGYFFVGRMVRGQSVGAAI